MLEIKKMPYLIAYSNVIYINKKVTRLFPKWKCQKIPENSRKFQKIPENSRKFQKIPEK
jgi:hypothetical protein